MCWDNIHVNIYILGVTVFTTCLMFNLSACLDLLTIKTTYQSKLNQFKCHSLLLVAFIFTLMVVLKKYP